MTLGSLFDGSGGFPLAGQLNGITPVWASEIEPFPIKVTRKHFPQMEHLGDIHTINGAKIQPVNIITFGSPCQDMSVAKGKRDGLAGSRSNLFFEAIRVIKEMRNATHGEYPRFIVWENVQGAFTSNKGEDFRHVLEAICRVADENVSILRPDKWSNAGEIMGDGYSVAWRLLDAQYWGVPQRRRRIYLVADFGGKSAPEVLFKPESVPRDIEHSGAPRQRTSGGIEEGFNKSSVPITFKARCGKDGGGKGFLMQEDKSATLSCSQEQVLYYPLDNNASDGRFRIKENGIFPALTARMDTGGGNGPMVAYGLSSKNSNAWKSSNPKSGIYEAQTSRTLDCNGGNPSCNQGGIIVIQGNTIDRSDTAGAEGAGWCEDVSYTLNTADRHAVAYGLDRAALEQGKNARYKFTVCEELQPPMIARGAGAVYTMQPHGRLSRLEANKTGTLVASDYKAPLITHVPVIRRLTPLECCRLQGFPDDWCKGLEHVPDDAELKFWRGVFQTYAELNGQKKRRSDKQIIKWLSSPHTDSAEYKMWGNGIALPCAAFVLCGIVNEGGLVYA